ncbi:phospholipid carrier-dependent glycosyltransferase [Phytohabitans rumicis]|uniref:ArnT-like N-terminal domain-containing protein n=1 Tax=Phytohabitans rumicis TaxID=1076125 RepID=A0A6V8L7P1_9ACTN|nr:phospholipid carrier-dependent glycosyltransferase [Phytohabitans rumicis]GFJ90146.1 hypothetical protein Prum_037880 [Phytohabitans rumicis]
MTATLSPQVEAPSRPARSRYRAVDLLRRHRAFAVLLLLGVALRLLFMIAYRPAFWYNGDSGVYVQMAERELVPSPLRAQGYPVLLKVFAPTGTFTSVALFQHLLGLTLAVLVYVFLRRRHVKTWVACVAVVPLLFDSLVLTVEHYLLPDTLFTFLLAVSVLLVLWHRKPGWRATTASGLLLAGAWCTKPTAFPVVLLIGLFLLVRRAGWRPVIAFAVAFAVPYLAVMSWVGDRQSVYGSQAGIALYGRAAMIVDCDRVTLTAQERTLCPTRRFDRADAYFWTMPTKQRFQGYTPAGEKLFRDFSVAVIRQQPLDYLRTVGKESVAHFVPGFRLGPNNDCLRLRWAPPEQWRDSTPVPYRCPPARARADFAPPSASLVNAPTATPLTRALHAYGTYVRLIPITLSACLLLTLAALALVRRGRAELLLLLLSGVGLTILTVALGMYEARYAMPALPLAAAGAALAWHGLRERESHHGAAPSG